MDDSRKRDYDPEKVELIETRRSLIEVIQMCEDEIGYATESDIYRNARRYGIKKPEVDKSLQLLRQSGAIIETSNSGIRLTHQ